MYRREIKFQEKWRIALDLLDRSLPGLPHGWITGDDEFGRSAEFRDELRHRNERYVLDVPMQHLGARPGTPTASTPQEGTRPQARSAVPAGRRLGDESAAVAVGHG